MLDLYAVEHDGQGWLWPRINTRLNIDNVDNPVFRFMESESLPTIPPVNPKAPTVPILWKMPYTGQNGIIRLHRLGQSEFTDLVRSALRLDGL